MFVLDANIFEINEINKINEDYFLPLMGLRCEDDNNTIVFFT
jgi:hypothetical protein